MENITNDKITINLLGDFKIEHQDSLITLNDLSKQVCSLIAFLAIKKDYKISTNTIIENLWETSVDNPYSALKNLVYRTRKLLETCGFKYAKDFIVSCDGTYCLNKNLDIITDVKQLTDINKKISEAKNSLDAKQLYISSFDLYKGNFLSNIGSLNWCIPIVETYHSMFFNMVYSLLDIFNQESDFINMILFAKKAISIDKFDENCNRYIMLGLSKTGHPLQALGHYNYLKNLYYDELDTVLSKETEQLYITISKTTKKENIELISLLNEIEESPYSSDTPIFCEFEIFKQFYHLTAKSSSRQHSNSSILLLNLTDKNDKLLPLEKRQEAMNNLFNCISNTIRREDIFCRCSLNQYLIILNNVDDKSAIRVVTRIKEKHSKLYSNKKIKLTVKSHEIV